MRNKRFEFPALVGCLVSLLAAASRAQIPNTLTGNESLAGYDLLFNGSDLKNWHAYRDTAVTDAWSVKTDQPLGARIQNRDGIKRPILTDRQYKNFDLKIDVQVPIDGNSGIFTRYEEAAVNYGDSRSGPEFQICGPVNRDAPSLLTSFGSVYDMFKVEDSLRTTWYHPSGSWNQVRIIAYDSNYVHYGNGKKLLEYKIGTPEFRAAYEESKFVVDGNNGRYYDIHPGGFLLQHYGPTGITFRNIKAKELNVHPFRREFPDGKWPDKLPQNFVFGKPGCTDKTSAHYDPTAEVADSALCVTVGVGVPEGRARPEARISSGGAGWTLVSLPSKHEDFRALDMDGRQVSFRILGNDRYAIDRQGRSGVFLLHFKAGGRTWSKIVASP